MQAKFITPESPLWEQVLSEVTHDFHHLPGYARFCAEQDHGEPVAFFAEKSGQRFLVPLTLRPISFDIGSEGLFDAISPYGYPGPLISSGPNHNVEDFFTWATAEMLENMQRLRIVSAFVRLHPLFSLPESSLRTFGTLVGHGETISIDLTLTREEIWQRTRENHRRDIKRADREGHAVKENIGRISDFASFYHETMNRVGADETYYFPHDSFEKLHHALGDRLHLIVVEISGEPACMGLFTEVCGIVQYHLSGTRDAFLRHRPSKTMLNFVRYWAKDRGNRVFHLGGGVGGRNDALFDFKAGFSKTRSPFYTWRLVADEAAYLHLNARWQLISGFDPDGIEGFFPAYRKTIAHQPQGVPRGTLSNG